MQTKFDFVLRIESMPDGTFCGNLTGNTADGREVNANAPGWVNPAEAAAKVIALYCRGVPDFGFDQGIESKSIVR